MSSIQQQKALVYLVLCSSRFELGVVEVRIESLLLQQLFVCAALNNIAVIQYQDAVRIADGR